MLYLYDGVYELIRETRSRVEVCILALKLSEAETLIEVSEQRTLYERPGMSAFANWSEAQRKSYFLGTLQASGFAVCTRHGPTHLMLQDDADRRLNCYVVLRKVLEGTVPHAHMRWLALLRSDETLEQELPAGMEGALAPEGLAAALGPRVLVLQREFSVPLDSDTVN